MDNSRVPMFDRMNISELEKLSNFNIKEKNSSKKQEYLAGKAAVPVADEKQNNLRHNSHNSPLEPFNYNSNKCILEKKDQRNSNVSHKKPIFSNSISNSIDNKAYSEGKGKNDLIHEAIISSSLQNDTNQRDTNQKETNQKENLGIHKIDSLMRDFKKEDSISKSGGRDNSFNRIINSSTNNFNKENQKTYEPTGSNIKLTEITKDLLNFQNEERALLEAKKNKNYLDKLDKSNSINKSSSKNSKLNDKVDMSIFDQNEEIKIEKKEKNKDDKESDHLLETKNNLHENNENEDYEDNLNNDEVFPSSIPLPPKINYEFTNQPILKGILEREISNYITNSLFIWDINDTSFDFELPPSIFSEYTYVHFSNYHQDEIIYAEENADRELTTSQFNDIFSNGKFKIESNVPGLPYEWYITKWIIKGTSNIYKDFIDAVGLSFYLVYKLKHRFIYTGGWGFSFQDSIKAIFRAGYETISCLIGLPSFEYKRQDNYVNQNLQKEYVQQFLRDQPEFTTDIFHPEFKEQVRLLSESFELRWEKESQEEEQRLFEGRLTNDEVKQTLYSLRLDRIIKYIKGIHTDEEVKDLFDLNILTPRRLDILAEYFLAHNIVDKNFLIEGAKISDIKSETEQGIQNEFSIRSKVTEWKNNKINLVQADKIAHLKKETENLIVNEMKQLNLKEPVTLFLKNCRFQEVYTEMFDRGIEKNLKKVPSTIFLAGFYYLTPKETYLHEDSDGSQTYKVKEGYFFKLPSSFPFWRFPLYFIRYFSFSYNIAIYCWRMIFNSRFGISSFYEDEIITNWECNPDTGTLTYTKGTSTLKSNLSKLCSSISEDRRNFEESPDDSFFGKSCARIFNLIYNYILKTFVALFVFMIGYPILIFFCSAFWLMALLTCYIWGLIGIVFLAFWNLFIYDVDYPAKDGYGLGLIPIFFYTICCKFAFQFFATVFLLVAQPFLAIFIFFLGIIRMVFRFCYDCFMFVIIWIFAKTPISDSFLAWKISGPGLTRKFYNHIEISDALTVIHAQIEKCELLNYKTQVCQLLEEPYRKYATSIAKFFSQFDLKFQPNQDLEDSIKYYKNKLLSTIYDRVSYFPRVKNVKFSSNELTTLKLASREYIRDYVTSHNMDYLFDTHKLPKNSWASLNEMLLKSAFGEQILESLTDLDFKIEIHREENINFDNIKTKIIEKSKMSAVAQQSLKKNYIIEHNNLEIKDVIDPTVNRFLYLNLHSMETNASKGATYYNPNQNYERNKDTVVNMNQVNPADRFQNE